MLKKIDNTKMGHGDHGWLKSIFHFSFAEYYNPQNMNFGVLRVINDDLINAGSGFDTHPHRDMEIVTYVVTGELTHGDSMGNKNTISRGDLQYMSAGSGIHHSEYNRSKDTARFLQIWILPEKKGLKPSYGDMHFTSEQRHNAWLNVVSGTSGTAPVKIHQDASIYVLELDQDRQIDFAVDIGRQAYLVQIEGSSLINGLTLNMRDGLEVSEETLRITAVEKSHYLLVEMKKS